MFLMENNRRPSRKIAMHLKPHPALLPIMVVVVLAVPAAALATLPNLPQHAGIAAVIVWLAGLGWGFHALLHRRLAAEDRLARLEAEVVCERDARAAQLRCTRLCMLALDTEWQRLDECLRNGRIEQVSDGMRAVESAIMQLHETA